MKPGGGKKKGAEFEREICRKLSLWISRGQYDDVFWRSAMSGGRATLAQLRRLRIVGRGGPRTAQDGDLSAIREEGFYFCQVFTADCKNVKDLNLAGMFCNFKIRGVNEYWAKLTTTTGLHDKEPMLIVKGNYADTLVVTSQRGALMLGLLGKEFAIFPEHDAYFFEFNLFIQNASLVKPPKAKPKLKLRRRIT